MHMSCITSLLIQSFVICSAKIEVSGKQFLVICKVPQSSNKVAEIFCSALAKNQGKVRSQKMAHVHCFSYTLLQHAHGKAHMHKRFLTSNGEHDQQKTAGGVF